MALSVAYVASRSYRLDYKSGPTDTALEPGAGTPDQANARNVPEQYFHEHRRRAWAWYYGPDQLDLAGKKRKV